MLRVSEGLFRKRNIIKDTGNMSNQYAIDCSRTFGIRRVTLCRVVILLE
jgi:hypothetical protein